MKKLLLSLVGLLSLGMVMAQTDLFISEYVDGTGNNKAIEIYNPTQSAINLENYMVVRYSNGSQTYTAGGIRNLRGIIQPLSTFVLINGQTTSSSSSPACDPALQGILVQLGGTVNGMLDTVYPAPTYMNGNDAIGLLKKVGSNYVPVDLFGQVGLLSVMENAYGWSYVDDSVVHYTVRVVNGTDTTYVETQSTITNYVAKLKSDDGQYYGPFWMCWTKDHSLKRKRTVIEGVKTNPNPFVVTNQWEPLSDDPDVWTDLGHHDCIVNSITKTETLSFELFPNPANGTNVTFIANEPVKFVDIFNVIGQKVKTIEKFNGNSANIETIGMENGLYFVKAKTLLGKDIVKKLMLE